VPAAATERNRSWSRWRPLGSFEAVAQSGGVIEFLCVCYKVTIRDRIVSVAEEPLSLSGSL